MGALEQWRENVTKFTEKQDEINAALDARLNALERARRVYVDLISVHTEVHNAEAMSVMRLYNALAERVAELEEQYLTEHDVDITERSG